MDGRTRGVRQRAFAGIIALSSGHRLRAPDGCLIQHHTLPRRARASRVGSREIERVIEGNDARLGSEAGRIEGGCQVVSGSRSPERSVGTG